MPAAETRGEWVQRALLICGVLSPLVHLGMDRLAAKLLRGYSPAAQSMTELGAAGSATRSLVVTLTLAATVLMVAFGIGVWRSSGRAILPRIVAGLVMGNAIAGLSATLWFPPRFGERPAFGSPGVILMFLSVVFFVLAMVLGAVAFRGWFRILSIAIPASYILLAVLRSASAAASGGNVPMLIGAQERTMAYSWLVWVMALAVRQLLSVRKGL